MEEEEEEEEEELKKEKHQEEEKERLRESQCAADSVRGWVKALYCNRSMYHESVRMFIHACECVCSLSPPAREHEVLI